MPDDVRPLGLDDLDWVLDLSALRRERIAGFAARFWLPAPDARHRHGEFLSHQIQDPQVVSLRTDHGFAVGAPRGDVLDVDDLALDEDDLWPEDGTRLLQAVHEQGDLRFVCPVPEPARTQTAVALAMSLTDSWWHRDLDTEVPAAAVENSSITVAGASGRLVAAPPVYAPGGPVLLVVGVDSAAALTAVEDAASAAGAVVAVVQRSQSQPEDLVVDAGYKRTTDFYAWSR